MERRFRKFKRYPVLWSLVPFLLSAICIAASDKKAEPPVNENTSASLEMIAERMKALSGSLAGIPEPPQLNQVIQIPEDPNHKKETRK